MKKRLMMKFLAALTVCAMMPLSLVCSAEDREEIFLSDGTQLYLKRSQTDYRSAEWSEWYEKYRSDSNAPSYGETELSHFGILLTAPAPVFEEGINEEWGEDCWEFYGGVGSTEYTVNIVTPYLDHTGRIYTVNYDRYSDKYLPSIAWRMPESDRYPLLLSVKLAQAGIGRLAARKGLDAVRSEYDYDRLLSLLELSDYDELTPLEKRVFVPLMNEKERWVIADFHIDTGGVKGFIHKFPADGKPDEDGGFSCLIDLYREDDMNSPYYIYIYTADFDVLCSMINSVRAVPDDPV